MNYLDCSFNINGSLKQISIIEDKTLIFVLRDEFGLTGTKLGCGLEQCGSCAVLINGEKKLSCNLLAKDYQNCEITTIVSLTSLFKKNKNPSNDEINTSLSEHLCRCGSHNSINKAIIKIKSDLN